MDRSAATTWETALGQLQLQVSPANFETWLRDTIGLRYENERFVVGVASDFAIEWLRTPAVRPVIARALSRQLGETVSVDFEVRGVQLTALAPMNGNGHSNGNSHGHQPAQRPVKPASLHPKLTFETFAAARCNRAAHHAAVQLADGTATFQLLLLWGGAGLGKTHLLHAIAHAAVDRGCHVQLAAAEQFTNDFVHALSTRSTNSFRTRYRECQLLLLDEFDLLASKTQTQEQFYHLLNYLWNHGGAVALALREPPGDLAGLSAGLQSRIRAGLAVELRPPSFDDRLRILQEKSSRLARPLPLINLQAIARRPYQQITDLEGALNRVVHFANLTGWPPTLQDTYRALDPFRAAPHQPTPQDVVAEVLRHFNISRDDLVSPSRAKDLTYARHMAMYLLRNLTHCSLTQTATLLGRRDHSTVIHAVDRIRDEIERSEHTRTHLQQLYDKLRSPAA